MRLLSVLGLLVLSGWAAAQEPYKDFLPGLPKTIARPMENDQEFLRQCRDEEAYIFIKRTGKPYSTALYKASHSDASALQDLFRVAPYQDGAGAQGFAETLFWLMHRVGDDSFSMHLGKQSPKVRKSVIGLLDYGASYDYSSQFPKTFRSAPHAPQ
jgi:hypothetical protein